MGHQYQALVTREEDGRLTAVVEEVGAVTWAADIDALNEALLEAVEVATDSEWVVVHYDFEDASRTIFRDPTWTGQ